MQTPGHVLVIDQDAASRQAIAAMLKSEKHRVSEARDGREALARIHADGPDLILLDTALPDISGNDLLAILRTNRVTQPVPVLMLSAEPTDESVAASLDKGADEVLGKPVHEERLREAMRAHMHRRRPPKGGARAGAVANAKPVIYGYHVMNNIAGSDGQVIYMAVHTPTQSKCVIKTLVMQGQGPGVVARFLREGEMLARISHPNIVHERGHGIAGEHAYMVTDFIPGVPLKRMMGRPWAALEAVRLMMRVAAALDAVHAAGIVHRDVKPENLMLREGDLEPVLLDFGSARTARRRHTGRRAATVRGTPGYMAPEVIQGLDSAPPCDVYACGVMFHELLTGALPFVADFPSEVMRQHLRSPVPVLPARLAACQPLLSRMMAKNPGERPADGGALGMELASLWNTLGGQGAAGAGHGCAAGRRQTNALSGI